MSEIKLELLRSPFSPQDIEWRVQRSGLKGSTGWVQATAYIDNRAVQNRLDDVCGPDKWRNEFRPGPAGGVIAGISIKIDGEWVTKWDGAENTDVEAVKGGLSDSMKRAAVQWGIGRYLYAVESLYSNVSTSGDFFIKIWEYGADKKKTEPKVTGYWSAPKLPEWALPISVKEKPAQSMASVLTGTEKAPVEEEVDNPPTGAQIIQIKGKWLKAGGSDIAKRDAWIAKIRTEAQAAQAILQLDKEIERKTAEETDGE